jgi:hypothetical protein
LLYSALCLPKLSASSWLRKQSAADLDSSASVILISCAYASAESVALAA